MPIRANGPVPPGPPPQPEGLPPAAKWRPEDWRLHLYGLHWDGTEELLAQDVPVSDPEITVTVSGTDAITGTLKPEIPELLGLIEPWATVVVAEYQGSIMGACIVDDDPIQDAGLAFTSVGYVGYLSGMPYVGNKKWIQADPLNIARHMWAHVQGKQFGNLGLTLDDTTSPVRIGEPKGKDEDGNKVDAQPYVLAWYETDDLGRDFTELATSTPFDFREIHRWDGSGSDDMRHRLELGYPKIGRRQHSLRFEVGENVTMVPSVDTPGDEYASEVLMLGAGEGRKMLRAQVPTPYVPHQRRPWRRGRRVAVVDDKSLDSKRKVHKAAEAEAAWRGGGQDIATVVVFDHPNAPFGSWAPGDDIQVTGRDLPWSGDLNLWVRVLSTTYKPAEGRAELTVVSSERTNRG